MDQVPGDAMVVFKVKNLDDASKKVAKWAKDLGLDQMDPVWGDPLGGLADKAHMPGGRERTEDEYRMLLQEAGLRLVRVIPTASAVSVVEAI